MDEPILATRGMVASPHYLASGAGVATLRAGGNAVDAAVVTAAVLAVVYPHMCSIGGDAFLLVWDSAAGQAIGLNGSGRAPAGASPKAFAARALDSVPIRGGLPVTVPGVVDAWAAALDRHGTWPLARALEAAIAYAEEGFPVTQKLAGAIARNVALLRQSPALAATVLRGGEVPQAGDRLASPALARTLRRIAEDGPKAFYRGEVARRLARAAQESGGFLTEEDLASHRADWVNPIAIDYRGVRMLELPPNTQGLVALLMLKILEDIPLERLGHNSAKAIHFMVEAKKLAFQLGAKWITDPDSMPTPVDSLLAPENITKLRAALGATAAVASPPSGPAGGDTVYLCAVDERGNACSLIQSIYYPFGSGVLDPQTGVLLQNRGAYFSLDPMHANVIAPRKRTYHTLMPGLALRGGQPWLVFGTMGAEGQPQTHVQLLTNVVSHHMDVQCAVSAPRWLSGRFLVGDDPGLLTVESRIPQATTDELTRLGHAVRRTESLDEVMGHAQAILIDPSERVLHGAADPRGDGSALGY